MIQWDIMCSIQLWVMQTYSGDLNPVKGKIQECDPFCVIPAVRPLILTTWTSPMTTAYYRSRARVPRDHVRIFIRVVAKSCISSFLLVVF